MTAEYVTPPTAPPQWSADDVAAAREQGREDLIVAARAAGQLADLLAPKAPPTDPSTDAAWKAQHPGQLSAADLDAMSVEAIADALAEGRLDALTGRQPRQVN